LTAIYLVQRIWGRNGFSDLKERFYKSPNFFTGVQTLVWGGDCKIIAMTIDFVLGELLIYVIDNYDKMNYFK